VLIPARNARVCLLLLPIRIVPASPALPPLAMSTLFEPVVRFLPALCPRATLTDLGIDLACHLAAGDDWLGLAVPKPVRVLLIEAEGPRPLFRDKLPPKGRGLEGIDLGDRLLVWEQPWAEFRFPNEVGASRLGEFAIDVVIVGPLTRVGMDELGTLQEVREFMDRVAEFRAYTGRRLAVVLTHHENKGGAVSGAWEGVADTLLHATVPGRGRTKLYVQKAR